MQLKPITAKKHILDHYKEYGLGLKSRKEMLELLNIFQANDTCLENVYEDWQNGVHDIMGIIGEWDSAAEVMESIMNYIRFFTEKQFINFILEKMVDLKDDGFDDPAEEIRTWTDDNECSDTHIEKTEDGYVMRVSY